MTETAAERFYDLIVIGTGSAATGVATRCREAGWSVAAIGEAPFGGTCALKGCEPKKTLWSVIESWDRIHRLGEGAGLAGAAGVSIDWPALMSFKRSFTDPVPEHKKQSFEDAGIELFEGRARFTGDDTVAIGEHEIRARHILIATGAVPTPVKIPGAEHLRISDDFLSLPELPKRIVFVGGGYISFEFAHMAVRAGAEVTILQADARPLAQFDHEMVERVLAHSRRIGIRVELNADVARIDKTGQGFAVETRDGRRFEADLAVHGLGRVPNLEPLDLAAAGIETEKGRLKLDEHLRCLGNPRVFAAGDAAGNGPALTPIASEDAKCIAANLLGECSHAPDYRGFASGVFTMPPLTMAGLTEEQAREKHAKIEVHYQGMDDYASVRREGHGGTGTAYKVLINGETGCIVGAHLFGPDAQEVINLFALSIRLGLKAEELGKLISAYPSSSSNVESMLK